jgi:hypothetical protein
MGDAVLDQLVSLSERGKKESKYDMVIGDRQGTQKNDAYSN